MKSKLTVVKIGGNVIDNPKLLEEFVQEFSQLQGYKILVHGGGKVATQLSKDMGISPQMYQGRRITTQQDLEIVTMVYAGLLNKQIVAKLHAKQCNALGLTGADANTIQSEKRSTIPIDFGYVGDVKQVNTSPIDALLNASITPVFCAITHDASGQLLNTNADTVTAEIARAMAPDWNVELLYCFEKKGVLDDVNDEQSVITHINRETYNQLKNNGQIHDGMLPKLANCFHALEGQVSRVVIGDMSILKQRTLCTTLTI